MAQEALQVWQNGLYEEDPEYRGQTSERGEVGERCRQRYRNVRLGLEVLVRRAAYDRLRTIRGSEPHAVSVPRRREKTANKRKVA